MTPDQEPSAWKGVGQLASVGMTMVLSTVIGLAGGWWLDRWLGTRPWLMLVGLMLGIAAGFVVLFRTARDSEQDWK
ncbi:MAG: AtpZ/AtpI family protein [Candidatus Rokubacteria bacterium]|nr:AtpZ/AtpI family protein [Candidatus Rokubacteria bacterium]MBI3825405.1 AtpZ/AtpI family protein [Candidatus Rokubacteria bacterium]